MSQIRAHKNGRGDSTITAQHTSTDAPLIPVGEVERLSAINPAFAQFIFDQTRLEAEHRRHIQSSETREQSRINGFIFKERIWLMLLFVCIGTGFGIRFLAAAISVWPNIALGSVLALYALIALFHPKFSISSRFEQWLSPVVGGLTGILTGATGVFVIPAVPYISSLNLSKDELIQALGLSFTISTIALAVGLGLNASFSQRDLVLSLLAVLPAMLGMFIGQKSRDKIEPLTFRRYFFGALFCLGAYMAIHSGYKLLT